MHTDGRLTNVSIRIADIHLNAVAQHGYGKCVIPFKTKCLKREFICLKCSKLIIDQQHRIMIVIYSHSVKVVNGALKISHEAVHVTDG